MAGCHSGQQIPTPPRQVSVEDAQSIIRIVDGIDAKQITWQTLINEMMFADIIIVGEMHDDPVGHAVELSLVTEVTKVWPGTVLCLEMLERDEQPLVDDYRDGFIDTEAFQSATKSTDWAGVGSFDLWYQPLMDITYENGGSVVAANAPRRYVKVARRDGYEVLEALPKPRRDFIAVPLGPVDKAYFERFTEVMGGHGENAPDPQVIEDVFRAQRVWDETMAHSIVMASENGAQKVIHIVGQFHSDFDGGLVDAIETMAPDIDVMVISLQPTNHLVLHEDDFGRADFVVYTAPADNLSP